MVYLGVIVVLIGHDEVLVIYVAIFVVIFCNWRCTFYTNESESGAFLDEQRNFDIQC